MIEHVPVYHPNIKFYKEEFIMFTDNLCVIFFIITFIRYSLFHCVGVSKNGPVKRPLPSSRKIIVIRGAGLS